MPELPNLSLTVLSILIAFVLVALNGFFVAAEFAIVRVRRTRLEELAGKGVSAARVSIFCVDRLDEYLSATQLGITLVSLALGWIGEEAFFDLVTYAFPALLESRTAGHAIAVGLSFLVITVLHVVLGELVPKSMAIQRAEQVVLRIAQPLYWFYRFAHPLITVFTKLANWILRLMGFEGIEEQALSEEELKLVMKESHEEGVISESEAQIINRAFSFSDKRAIDILVPISRVEYISLNRSIEENIRVTRSHMHSRFPLCVDGPDSIIGIVHMKDAWELLSRERTNDSFRKVARPPVFIAASMRQDRVMKIFGEKRAHLAIVQDPHDPNGKKPLGIVTLEDILEELVGEIRDEHGH